jgi:hypothetical protein
MKILASGGTKAQSLPFVLMLAALLGILGAAMVTLFRGQQRLSVQQTCIAQKQELASMALEQTIYKLQQDPNWYNVGQTGMEDYNGYSHEFTASGGKYCVHIADGNLFLASSNLFNTRQGKKEYKTIGIKVKALPFGCTGNFYAVIAKMKFGGPLVSRGKIDLPCIQPANLNNPMPLRANLYWGDVFSANTNTGYCRIPDIDVGYGTGGDREKWLPQVYARNDIFTHINNASNGNWIFGYTYTEMSPTAHSHPFSEYATAPDIDFDWYRDQAKKQGSYYGPNYPAGPLSFVTQANVVQIMAKLKSPDSVLFIDTKDGLPVRNDNISNTYSANTYSGTTFTAANTLTFYVNAANQYLTHGTLIVMGPLRLIGDTPGNIANAAGFKWNYGNTTSTVSDSFFKMCYPDNFYFPTISDGYHFVLDNVTITNSKLTKVKHAGLMYVNSELRIGGPRSNTTYSNICIYGTVYIGEMGAINFDNTNDTPTLYVYYNNSLNLFCTSGNRINIISFSEITYLIPTANGTPSLTYPF